MRRHDILYPTFDTVASQPGFQSGGFREGTNDLEFYWHGDMGPEARAAIADARAEGTRVHVIQTDVSFEDLWDISLDLGAELIQADLDVRGFGPNREGDAIQIWGPDFLSTSGREQAEQLAADILPAGVRLEVIEEVGTVETSDTRSWDTGSPNPGSEIRIGNNRCTAALGISRGSTDYMLTAAHCFDYRNKVTARWPDHSGFSWYISTLAGSPHSGSSSDRLLDATLVQLPTTVVTRWMYAGGNGTSSKVPIDGTSEIPYGRGMLCHSSAATGRQCGLERWGPVHRVCTATSSGSCSRWADVVDIVRSSSPDLLAWGGGDSGGPVYTIDSSGDLNMVAIIMGGYPRWYVDSDYGEISCKGRNRYGGPCYSAGAATPLTEIMAELEEYANFQPQVTG